MSFETEQDYTDIDTKKCDMEYCNELTEKNEKYCLLCSKLIDDANCE